MLYKIMLHVKSCISQFLVWTTMIKNVHVQKINDMFLFYQFFVQFHIFRKATYCKFLPNDIFLKVTCKKKSFCFLHKKKTKQKQNKKHSGPCLETNYQHLFVNKLKKMTEFVIREKYIETFEDKIGPIYTVKYASF